MSAGAASPTVSVMIRARADKADATWRPERARTLQLLGRARRMREREHVACATERGSGRCGDADSDGGVDASPTFERGTQIDAAMRRRRSASSASSRWNAIGGYNAKILLLFSDAGSLVGGAVVSSACLARAGAAKLLGPRRSLANRRLGPRRTRTSIHHDQKLRRATPRHGHAAMRPKPMLPARGRGAVHTRAQAQYDVHDGVA